MKANPKRWMANPYAGDRPGASVERDLERLYASGSGLGYLAYGAQAGGVLPRIDGTGYFYRDGSELEEERETFEALTPR